MSWTDTPDELYDRQENDPTEPYDWSGPEADTPAREESDHAG